MMGENNNIRTIFDKNSSFQCPSTKASLMPVRMPLSKKPAIPSYDKYAMLPVSVRAKNADGRRAPFLKDVMFELTLSCNLNCIHCYCSAGKKRADELRTDEILHFISWLAGNKVETITFTGGEPLLHKDFLEISEFVRSKNVNISVFTNGELLDTKLLDALSKIKIGSIQVSLDGARPETHDYIRGKKGLFNKVIRGIEEIKARGIPVVVMTTLMEANQIEMTDINLLCKNLDIEKWCMNMFLPIGRGRNLKDMDFKLLSKIREEVGISPAPCDSTACGVGFEKIAILSNGDITPCEVLQAHKIGNIRASNIFDTFYKHPLMNEYRKSLVENIDKCAKCSVNKLCRGGCKTSALVRNSSLLAADPTSCYSWEPFMGV